MKRRNFVVGALAAGVVARTSEAFARASQPATRVNFPVPPGACDCHTHIHGDPAKYPMFPGRNSLFSVAISSGNAGSWAPDAAVRKTILVGF